MADVHQRTRNEDPVKARKVKSYLISVTFGKMSHPRTIGYFRKKSHRPKNTGPWKSTLASGYAGLGEGRTREPLRALDRASNNVNRKQHTGIS